MKNTWTGKSVCRRVTKPDMPDLFSDITKAPPDVLEVIVKTLELRAADPQLQSMLESYLSQIELPDPVQILEIGSGTGPVARRLASLEKADRWSVWTRLRSFWRRRASSRKESVIWFFRKETAARYPSTIAPSIWSSCIRCSATFRSRSS